MSPTSVLERYIDRTRDRCQPRAGFAAARALAKTGNCVILTGRDQDRTDAAAAALGDEGLDVEALPLDVEVPSSIAAAAEQVERDHGRLDVLVNNAGVLPEATDTTEHTMGSLNDQADPDSPYYQMIVPAYQASKAALNSVTISVAKKLADTDIKVTAVCPAFVQTDLTPVNREQAPLFAAQAATVIVTAATLPSAAPSGRFIDQNGPVAW